MGLCTFWAFEFISPCLYNNYLLTVISPHSLIVFFYFVKVYFIISYEYACVRLCGEARGMGSLLSLSYRQLGATRVELGTN